MFDLFSKKNKILKFIENGDSENLSSILNKISDINENFPGLIIKMRKNGRIYFIPANMETQRFCNYC